VNTAGLSAITTYTLASKPGSWKRP
jgi:hypothetical protein